MTDRHVRHRHQILALSPCSWVLTAEVARRLGVPHLEGHPVHYWSFEVYGQNRHVDELFYGNVVLGRGVDIGLESEFSDQPPGVPG